MKCAFRWFILYNIKFYLGFLVFREFP